MNLLDHRPRCPRMAGTPSKHPHSVSHPPHRTTRIRRRRWAERRVSPLATATPQESSPPRWESPLRSRIRLAHSFRREWMLRRHRNYRRIPERDQGRQCGRRKQGTAARARMSRRCPCRRRRCRFVLPWTACRPLRGEPRGEVRTRCSRRRWRSASCLGERRRADHCFPGS